VPHWIVFSPWARRSYQAALDWLVVPLAYFAYSLLRGAALHWYPYPAHSLTSRSPPPSRLPHRPRPPRLYGADPGSAVDPVHGGMRRIRPRSPDPPPGAAGLQAGRGPANPTRTCSLMNSI
jgi:hypothetical protein